MSQMRARIVAPEDLTPADLAAWSACATAALEPNPFFEPDWLLPALEHICEPGTPNLVLAQEGSAIHACIPVTKVAPSNASPPGHTRHAALLTRVAPSVIPLGTPLVTTTGGAPALACLLEGLSTQAQRSGADLVVMDWVSSAGPVARLLRDATPNPTRPVVEFETWQRALLRRRPQDHSPYWQRNISKHHLRTIRQHGGHLAGAFGTSLCMRRRTDDSAVTEFLALEESGWKGHQPDGLALRRQQGSAHFFATACSHYLNEGRLWFTSLEADGSPLAMICFVRAGAGQFAFRTAYNEDFARFGPGVQVFLAAMEDFASTGDAHWLDTCSAPSNQHLLALFPDRQAMSTFMFRVPTRACAGGISSVALGTHIDSTPHLEDSLRG